MRHNFLIQRICGTNSSPGMKCRWNEKENLRKCSVNYNLDRHAWHAWQLPFMGEISPLGVYVKIWVSIETGALVEIAFNRYRKRHGLGCSVYIANARECSKIEGLYITPLPARASMSFASQSNPESPNTRWVLRWPSIFFLQLPTTTHCTFAGLSALAPHAPPTSLAKPQEAIYSGFKTV